MKPLPASFSPDGICSMSPLTEYVEFLETAAQNGTADSTTCYAIAVSDQTSKQLRERVPLETRRQFGAFFTSANMAKRLTKDVMKNVVFYWDPTVGGGDLLLAAAINLPVADTLDKTLRQWSTNLGGRDLHEMFVRTTRARLVLLARARGKFTAPMAKSAYRLAFENIKVGDGLAKNSLPQNAVVLMNPPYSSTQVENNWASGKVNMAAVFVAHYTNIAPQGTQILAILPEVIRSGSNYNKLRAFISSRTSMLRAESWGLFDNYADVDVFNLHIVIGDCPQKLKNWCGNQIRSGTSLQALFDVSVGAVVPHRHLEAGVLRRFVDARSVPTCGTVKRVRKRRRFSGTVVQPPFVTIKRTSRPGDRHRAAPTLILGSAPVAVENHLIVCRPKDGSLEACHQLFERLKTNSVTEWLDATIRCRHLTVGVVRNILLHESSERSETV